MNNNINTSKFEILVKASKMICSIETTSSVSINIDNNKKRKFEETERVTKTTEIFSSNKNIIKTETITEPITDKGSEKKLINPLSSTNCYNILNKLKKLGYGYGKKSMKELAKCIYYNGMRNKQREDIIPEFTKFKEISAIIQTGFTKHLFRIWAVSLRTKFKDRVHDLSSKKQSRLDISSAFDIIMKICDNEFINDSEVFIDLNYRKLYKSKYK